MPEEPRRHPVDAAEAVLHVTFADGRDGGIDRQEDAVDAKDPAGFEMIGVHRRIFVEVELELGRYAGCLADRAQPIDGKRGQHEWYASFGGSTGNRDISVLPIKPQKAHRPRSER